MRVDPQRLATHLKDGPAPVYLVSGDEPLLVEEACDAIRAAARAAGYSERTVLNVEPQFDWNRLAETSQTLSLFATRRIVELRLPTGRPGDAGSKALTQYAGDPPPDTLLLVITGKLEKAARESKWAKALDAAGVTVTCWPLDTARLPGWINQRMQSRGLVPEAGVADILAYYLQGNLLAVAQEIDKLALTCPDGQVDADAVRAGIADSARFDVYGLVDGCLAGKAAQVARMLASLESEGLAPALVLWALGREIRAMARLAADLAGGMPQAQAFKAHRVWASRAPVVSAAQRRLKPAQWRTLLQRVAYLDRVLKGQAPGRIWRELEQLALVLCGVELPIWAAAG
jgi:DNA polymerase-3 subunit delta